MLMLGGFPIPKKFPISAWVFVLIYSVCWDLIYGILFQGIWPITRIGHFAHLGGYLAGLILALYWNFHHKHKRDYYIECAEDLAKAPFTGALATLKTYQQALELDPNNGKILLELARASFNLSRLEQSKDYYRKAILAFSKDKQENELAYAYAEAFEYYQLVFVSEYQLELIRLLLKNKKWKIALNALEIFCQKIEQNNFDQNLTQLYIRAKLIICFILDQYQQDFSKARATLENLLNQFPNHPLLKYPKQRLEHYGEQNKLFNFNPQNPSYPFTPIKNNTKKINTFPTKKFPWYKVRKMFILGASIFFFLIIYALWLILYLIFLVLVL